MSFAAPWVLLGLGALPVLWWLLRVTPPAPRRQRFPAVRLLLGLVARAETPAHTPWWLLALRLAAAGLAVVALAGPVLGPAPALPGNGPVLVVLDDGWAAAADWPRRAAAAGGVIDGAEREGRRVALLATAPDGMGAPPALSPLLPAAEARRRLATLRPQPWAVDRAAAAKALSGWRGTTFYVADGVGGAGWAAFAAALEQAGPVVELADEAPPARLMLPPRGEAERIVARVARVPDAAAASGAVLAQAGDGRTLARAEFHFSPGAGVAEAAIALPAELRNRLERLAVEQQAGAGAVALLDERWRRRPVGLLAGDADAATPLLGALFYLRRALAPDAELREGRLAELLAGGISVLIAADWTPADAAERDAVAGWVARGGMLVRFAGPRLAAHPDSLLPVALLAGERQLGGTMSWGTPEGLAPFPAGSPFAGLAIPAEVTVSRQVLAEPGAGLAAATWAALADGTPLVTQAARGAGRVVLFHVPANAEWSSLPLSGLFPPMLGRLVALSAGVAAPGEADPTPLAPAETLDGFGVAGPPPPAARAATAAELAAATVSPRHPPGFYGPAARRRALSLGNRMEPPEAAPALPSASRAGLDAALPPRALGPWLMAVAVALLALDFALSLWLRGLGLRGLGWRRTGAAVLMAGALMAPAAQAQETGVPPAALQTRLAYVASGDAARDAAARAGLAGLSAEVDARTSAVLGPPDAVVPGRDDLSLYPLLYWPVAAGTLRPDPAARVALDRFMAGGGILVIDTGLLDEEGSGRLAELTRGLDIPPLAPLSEAHVLARSFYLLSSFPGRLAGGTVWVQRDQDRANDDVSPVVIGAADWAGAWTPGFSGDARQRLLAVRFGVNLVIYALTGTYKADQVHLPTLMQRLGH